MARVDSTSDIQSAADALDDDNENEQDCNEDDSVASLNRQFADIDCKPSCSNSTFFQCSRPGCSSVRHGARCSTVGQSKVSG